MLRRKSSAESGQVLVIFAFAFIAIIMMLALLFDGARALVLRRQMQDASDAAALAGANVLQGLSSKQCSASADLAAVTAAAKASVAANLPNYPPANVLVTCAPGWNNVGVKVRLDDDSPTFFGQIFGGGPLAVVTDSTAINGADIKGQFSVVLLDPYNPTWQSGYRGCPSFLISGTPTLTFESTIFIDSACSAANGGAFSTNGNAATLTFVAVPPNPPAAMRIVGEYKPTALSVTPAPLEHQWPPKPDPFLDITNEPPGPISGGRTLKVWPAKSVNSSTPQVLQPGIYRGGISIGATAVVYLTPGIYVMDGGGFFVNASAHVYSVPANTIAASYNPSGWTTSCAPNNCGILLYNTGTTGNGNGVTQWGPIKVNAGATFKVRSYNPAADTTMLSDGTAYVPDPVYKNFLIWQSRTPAPFNTVAQQIVTLGGGGNVFMAGTVYAPGAKVYMAGGSGGSAGDLTLQFVAWDLEMNGNTNFYFHYDAQQFPQLLDYGLVE
jgi:hypothetical protein